MSDRTPWWPLRWEETPEMDVVRFGHNPRKRYYNNGRMRSECTITLPNARRFTVIDRTSTDEGYAVFAVDPFGVTDGTPTEQVPDLISLRCFLQAEADA